MGAAWTADLFFLLVRTANGGWRLKMGIRELYLRARPS